MDHRADISLLRSTWSPACNAENAERQRGTVRSCDGVSITPEEFAVLYQRYAPILYNYFMQQILNAADAEDLTATTIIKALHSLRRYTERGSFASWLFTIARRSLVDFRRRHRSEIDVSILDPPLADRAPLPENQVIDAERDSQLRRLVNQLPVMQREAVILRYFAALSIAEVAAVIRKREGAVKLLLHRGLTTLRARYYQGGLE